MKSDIAIKWLNGEISTGKLFQELEIPRPTGDDLAGIIWQAYAKKLSDFKADLEHKRDTAERFYREAEANGNKEEAAAESTSRLAYQTALSQFQMHFGTCMP